MAEHFEAPREQHQHEGEDRDGDAGHAEHVEADRYAAKKRAKGVEGVQVLHDVSSGDEAKITSISDGVAPSAIAIQ